MVVTRRQALAQVVICLGCCCGRTEKGKPPVPSEWLKTEWKKHKLHGSVHLTVGGCLGPCDVANVVLVTAPSGQIWLGGISSHAVYEALLDWARRCKAAQQVLSLPAECTPFVFSRYKTGSGQPCPVSTDPNIIDQ